MTMSPMYKVTPNRVGNIRWTKVDTSQNTKRMQALAWLNTEEGRYFLQQIVAKQSYGQDTIPKRSDSTQVKGSSTLQPTVTRNTPTSPVKASKTDNFYPLAKEMVEEPSKNGKVESRAKPKTEEIYSSGNSFATTSSHRLSTSTSPTKSEPEARADNSLSPSRSSRVVRNPRLLDENASLFPRPVKSAPNTDMIASILEKSLIERQRLASR